MNVDHSDPLTCVTNSLPDFRGCVMRDHHYTDFPDMRAHYATCDGCLQRPAHTGFVCAPCYTRIDDALITSRHWRQMLAGVDRAMQAEPTTGGKPGGSVPIAPVPLTMEELGSYEKSCTGTAERWVADRAGATDAVRFARAMEAAARNHPTAETPHNVNRTRCPQCEQQTLVWNPPAYFGADVRVTCRNPECDYEADQTAFDAIANIEGATGRPLNSRRVEHEDLGGRCSCGADLPSAMSWTAHIMATLTVDAA